MLLSVVERYSVTLPFCASTKVWESRMLKYALLMTDTSELGPLFQEPENPIARWWLGLRRPPCVAWQWGHMQSCWMQGCEAVLALWWLGPRRSPCVAQQGGNMQSSWRSGDRGWPWGEYMGVAPEGQTLSGLLQCVLRSLQH